MAPHTAASKQQKSKAVSKQQRSKPPSSTLAAPLNMRTASGQECQPTEKETYCFKEQKLDKQKKKALKAAYQNHPDGFEQEPSELHSDIDRQEDMMFSDHSIETKLSNTSALKFSAAKIPPRTKGTMYSGQHSHLRRW
ncbi:hypothetical protein BDR07DRAFT_1494786 [Suillus spraguei]|nr:hypothetical protein BDR07DRAFT_1499799 [Suillus spraguei]KAG2354269.1 hypothetical protein BDR07DRAFT_1494786 [Suillus spraguei]